MSVEPKTQSQLDKEFFSGRRHLMPCVFETFATAANIIPIWFIGHRKRQKTSNDNNTNAKKEFSDLTYQEMLHVLEFLVTNWTFKTRHSWGYGEGGDAHDFIIREKVFLSATSKTGIASGLLVDHGGLIKTFVFDLDAKNTVRLSWENEEDCTRQTKPEWARIKFGIGEHNVELLRPRTFQPQKDNEKITIEGQVRFPQEGPIECTGTLKVFDSKGKSEQESK
jgi:hypothetical protein